MKDAHGTWEKLGAEMRLMWSLGQLQHALEKHREHLELLLTPERLDALIKALQDIATHLEGKDDNKG